MQRRFNETTGPMDHSLRDYSTIAIGLYAFGASIPSEKIIQAQDMYARLERTIYAKDEVISEYGHLPQRNVENTLIGYEMGKRIANDR